MNKINQVLITIYEANRLVTSENPHYKRLGLLMLDNIIELQIRYRVNMAMLNDQTAWYGGTRKYNAKRRSNVNRDYLKLLALAVDENFITGTDKELLAFAHKRRNHLYHEGHEEDSTDLELGICILLKFITDNFPKWRGSNMLIPLSTKSPLQHFEARFDHTGEAPLQFDFNQTLISNGLMKAEGWKSVLSKVVTYDFNKDLRLIIQHRLESLIDGLEKNIRYLTEYDDNDFYGVLGHRFSIMTDWFCQQQREGKAQNDPRIAANVYLAVLEHEEELLDIKYLGDRGKKFTEIVNNFNFKKDILSSNNFEKHRFIIKNMPTESVTKGIEKYIQAEKDLRKLKSTLEELAIDLSGYTSYMIDYIRGK
jgi:hypothetical protein